ncbi:MAG: ribosome biogenesis/translation initiation ATPase RLI [Candidatus Heimdallarchaeota archaeon]
MTKLRIAVLNREKCRPTKCAHECQRLCPRWLAGDQTVTFEEGEDKPPTIVEALCIGAGICVKKCPFGAVEVVNLPKRLESDLVFRYGRNMFELFRLPIAKKGKVLGLVGQNGAGKSTALRLLLGDLQPNLGRYDDFPTWDELIKVFRGSELHTFFEDLSAGEVRAVLKPQYVDKLAQLKGTVQENLERADEKGELKEISTFMGLSDVLDRKLSQLSGGELQKTAIGAALLRDATLYLFDEPSSFLDVYERMRMARAIRLLLDDNKTVVVVEHDLAVLDYVSDVISIFYGHPGVYGIVSHPHGVREGINLFLAGYLPDENMRFRPEGIKFEVRPALSSERAAKKIILEFEPMKKSLNGFTLDAQPGDIREGEIIGCLGPNAIGKTTFVKLLAGVFEPDKGKALINETEELQISYKPQYITPSFEGIVGDYLAQVNQARIVTTWFKSDVLKGLGVDQLMERELTSLSGGELQKVEIAACLARDADLFLLDEPSAYISAEDRLAVAKVIKKRIERLEEKDKAAFIVEHDVTMIDYLADSMIVFQGAPGQTGKASRPVDLRTGMNAFLSDVQITFRRDPESGRPRVNKPGSRLDREQKDMGEYFYLR